MDTTWWADQEAQRAQFQAAYEGNLQQKLQSIDSLLADLTCQQTQRVQRLVDEGLASLIEKRHSEELKRLAEAEKAAQQKFEQEEARKNQESELQRAKLVAEQKARAREAEARAAETARKQAEKTAIEEAERSRKAQEARDAAERRKEAENAANKARFSNPPAEPAAKPATNAFASAPKPILKPSAAKPPSAAAKPKPSDSVTAPAHIEAEFNANEQRIQWIKNNVRAVVSSQSALRQQTSEIKLELRPKFGMLTNTKAQLLSCRDGCAELLRRVQSMQNPVLYQWTLNLFAKLLIEQSESEANVQLQNALPLAMLTILLWDEFAELGDYVIPRFIKRCPQLIGYYCSINTKEGRKRMGWKLEDADVYETRDQYTGRLCGVAAVWACMTQTKLPSSQKPHPYNLGHSWTFVARMLNKPLAIVTDTDFALAAAWWDMTALRLHDAFGKQADKLLNVLWDTFTQNQTCLPAMRLRGLGENWQTSGKIDHAWKVLK